MIDIGQPTDTELALHHCLEAVDKVPGDSETTAFKRRARLHQAIWRETRGLPKGSQPMRPCDGKPTRPIGSRIDADFAYRYESNFLTSQVKEVVRSRVTCPEPKQTINVDRLYCDLLSSMPMCFNLFGPIATDLDLATAAVRKWWPDAPGKVRNVRFEWSPGRQIPGQFLENRSAFDVAFELELDDHSFGIIGVETKYHEDCRPEKEPSNNRFLRYQHVTKESGVFVSGAIDSLIGNQLQQIWLDHLLAISMLQHTSRKWTWFKFILVHPSKNPSYARAADSYAKLLSDSSTFAVRTIESFLNDEVMPMKAAAAFRERYLW